MIEDLKFKYVQKEMKRKKASLIAVQSPREFDTLSLTYLEKYILLLFCYQTSMVMSEIYFITRMICLWNIKTIFLHVCTYVYETDTVEFFKDSSCLFFFFYFYKKTYIGFLYNISLLV